MLPRVRTRCFPRVFGKGARVPDGPARAGGPRWGASWCGGRVSAPGTADDRADGMPMGRGGGGRAAQGRRPRRPG
ncbi:hypothetical protein STXM2123_4942 [Streptomyces sp. F-3]|nr:hypothetical protein STXM2123_4942 [Streptomyces sp. F-3]